MEGSTTRPGSAYLRCQHDSGLEPLTPAGTLPPPLNPPLTRQNETANPITPLPPFFKTDRGFQLN
jgi:hypothetical protein